MENDRVINKRRYRHLYDYFSDEDITYFSSWVARQRLCNVKEERDTLHKRLFFVFKIYDYMTSSQIEDMYQWILNKSEIVGANIDILSIRNY